MNSILERAMEYVRLHPGLSSTQVANAIGEKRGTVSARLYEQYKLGILERRPGQGPQGGFGYRFKEKEKPVERKPLVDREILISITTTAATYEERRIPGELKMKPFEGAMKIGIVWENKRTGETGEKNFVAIDGERLRALEIEMEICKARWFE